MVLCFSLFSLPYLSANQDAQPISEREKELYLTASGKYTEADIAANGGKIPGPEKFQRLYPRSPTETPKRGTLFVPSRALRQVRSAPGSLGASRTSFAALFASRTELLTLAKEQPESSRSLPTTPSRAATALLKTKFSWSVLVPASCSDQTSALWRHPNPGFCCLAAK